MENRDKHIELTCKALSIIGININHKSLDIILMTFGKIISKEEQFSLKDMASIESYIEEKYREKLPFEEDKKEDNV